MIKLSEIELPDDLIWVDEYKWSGVAQQVDVLVGGAVVVQADAQQTGRLITLAGGDNFGWVSKDTLELLRTLSRQTDTEMTLTLNDGSEHNVIFTGDRLHAEQVFEHSFPDDEHPYVLTLYLMEL